MFIYYLIISIIQNSTLICSLISYNTVKLQVDSSKNYTQKLHCTQACTQIMLTQMSRVPLRARSLFVYNKLLWEVVAFAGSSHTFTQQLTRTRPTSRASAISLSTTTGLTIFCTSHVMCIRTRWINKFRISEKYFLPKSVLIVIINYL